MDLGFGLWALGYGYGFGLRLQGDSLPGPLCPSLEEEGAGLLLAYYGLIGLWAYAYPNLAWERPDERRLAVERAHAALLLVVLYDVGIAIEKTNKSANSERCRYGDTGSKKAWSDYSTIRSSSLRDARRAGPEHRHTNVRAQGSPWREMPCHQGAEEGARSG